MGGQQFLVLCFLAFIVTLHALGSTESELTAMFVNLVFTRFRSHLPSDLSSAS